MAGNSGTGIVLQERDLRLLGALETMRVINREQAKVVAGFGSTRRANDRLLTLTRSGFLKRAFVGSHEAVYWLPGSTQHGRNSRRESAPVEPAALFLRHRLEINSVQILVQYSGIPSRGWWFVRWQSFNGPLSGAVPLIPDGYFELGSSRGFRSMFVEVDLGTEAVAVLARKASLYLQLATSGEFSQSFNRDQFRVLIITTSARRLRHIREAVAKQTGKVFWFATLDAVSADKFWSAAWLRPTGDQPQALL